MKPHSVTELRHAVGGKALTAAPPTMPLIEAICTDTRQMQPRSLFVALKGDRFDAHDFLATAAAGGAIAAIVERPPAEPVPALHLIQVADARVALGRLARFVRQQMRAKVIGVVGSNGKTGTKLLIHAALSTRLRGIVSPKSYNNDIGVPLTLLPADPSLDYVIVEMGTNHPGEIANLAKIAVPDIAVITSIALEHTEFLGDLDGVRKENASVVEALTEKGLLVVNGDDPDLLALFATLLRHKAKQLTFGFNKSNDLFATDVECDLSGTRFKLNGRLNVFLPLLGKHTASNALVAFAIGRRMGLSEDQIIQGLAQAKGPDMRLQKLDANGVTLINDAYNANPGSMRGALETMAAFKLSGRKIAVLGDMLELGPTAPELHKQIGKLAAASRLDLLICVGARAADIASGAAADHMPAAAIQHFADVEAASAAVPALLKAGDTVLLKASRGIHLERVVDAILASRRGA